MAWIESHQALGRHPKLLKLAKLLGVNKAAALGHLHYLWYWALDYAQDGDLSRLSPAELALAAEWGGNETKFTQFLKDSRFVDQDGKLHDWDEYAGRLISERIKDKQRKRDSRNKEAVRRTSEGHPVDIRPPSGVPNPTQPNSTQPNPTEGGIPARADGHGETPTIEQVKAAVMTTGIPDGFVELVYAMWLGRSGKDGAGVAVEVIPYVRARWKKEEVQWRNGTHRDQQKGNNANARPNGRQGFNRNQGTLNNPSRYSKENLRKLPNYHGEDKVPDPKQQPSANV